MQSLICKNTHYTAQSSGSSTTFLFTNEVCSLLTELCPHYLIYVDLIKMANVWKTNCVII